MGFQLIPVYLLKYIRINPSLLDHPIIDDRNVTSLEYSVSLTGVLNFVIELHEEIGLDLIHAHYGSLTTIGPGRVDTYFNGKEPGDRPISLYADDVADQVIHVLNQSGRCEIERIYLKSNLE